MGFSLFGPSVEKLRAKGDAPGLLKALEEDGSRDAAIAALVSLGEKALDAVVSALGYEGRHAFGVDEALVEVAAHVGAPAVDPVLLLLERGGEGVKSRALAVLGRLGDRRAANAVRATLLGAGTQALKCDALKAIAALSVGEHVDLVVRALSDTDGRVRAEAASALGDMGDRAAIPALKSLWAKVEALDIAGSTLEQVEEVLGKQPPEADPGMRLGFAQWNRMDLHFTLAASLTMLGDAEGRRTLLRAAEVLEAPISQGNLLFQGAVRPQLERVVHAGVLSPEERARVEGALQKG